MIELANHIDQLKPTIEHPESAAEAKTRIKFTSNELRLIAVALAATLFTSMTYCRIFSHLFQ